MTEHGTAQGGRRRFLAEGLRTVGLLVCGGALGVFGARAARAESRWQIDPEKCTACGRCATNCVLQPSAVKCVHAYAMCGYCELCTGFFEPDASELTTDAANQQCPTAAIKRTWIEDPYYEYVIDAARCIGCGKCVKGCTDYGNGSLFLQIMHDRCTNCNQCSIATRCPSGAISRVSATRPYRLKLANDPKEAE